MGVEFSLCPRRNYNSLAITHLDRDLISDYITEYNPESTTVAKLFYSTIGPRDVRWKARRVALQLLYARAISISTFSRRQRLFPKFCARRFIDCLEIINFDLFGFYIILGHPKKLLRKAILTIILLNRYRYFSSASLSLLNRIKSTSILGSDNDIWSHVHRVTGELRHISQPNLNYKGIYHRIKYSR